MHNKYNKWVMYKNVLPIVTKIIHFESFTIHLVGVDMIEIANSILIIETYFYI